MVIYVCDVCGRMYSSKTNCEFSIIKDKEVCEYCANNMLEQAYDKSMTVTEYTQKIEIENFINKNIIE
jgi:DNA-directed RNA polymerase subunit RPC12/RpoP